jgi:hypothetical protein
MLAALAMKWLRFTLTGSTNREKLQTRWQVKVDIELHVLGVALSIGRRYLRILLLEFEDQHPGVLSTIIPTLLPRLVEAFYLIERL